MPDIAGGRLTSSRLDALHDWLQALQLKVLGNSGTTRAVMYCLKRWPALARYDDDRYPIDNNPIENPMSRTALMAPPMIAPGQNAEGSDGVELETRSGHVGGAITPIPDWRHWGGQ